VRADHEHRPPRESASADDSPVASERDHWMSFLRRLAATLRAPRVRAQFRPSIALWGMFDLPDYGNLLLPRILERELRRRLPLAQVVAYSPLGHDHPIPMD